jgi:hypothetical protein
VQQVQAIIAALLAAMGFHAAQQPQQQHQQQAAAADEVNCFLVVPFNPLSGQGLATPWVLGGQGAQAQNCKMSNAANAGAYVNGTIFDPATGNLSAYDPLVITRGTQPAVAPTPPTLPPGAVVGLDVGFNGNNLTLVGPGVFQGNCVNGVRGSIFGQVSFCNDVAFFQAVNGAHRTPIPALGTASDGKPCPTTRDFSVVDQDQSDNVTSTYLVTGNGQTAQNTAANRAALAGSNPNANGSDNRLLDNFVDPALGCTPMTVPNLADPNTSEPTQNTNELQAAAFQAAPIALIPAGDPMVLNDDNPDLNKLNAYRVNVDMAPAASLNDASTTAYCQNLLKTGLPRIAADQATLQNGKSPAADAATNLFTFLGMRFNASFGADNLNCTGLLGVQNPVALTVDGNNVVTAVTINLNPPPANAGQASGAQTNPAPSASPTPSNNPMRRHHRFRM